VADDDSGNGNKQGNEKNKSKKDKEGHHNFVIGFFVLEAPFSYHLLFVGVSSKFTVMW